MPARILVIDDNGANLELMLYLLSAFGHTVRGAVDGIDGLKQARSGVYDLILSDVLMPGIDGYELARRFTADGLRGRLVAVTALAMAGDRDRLLASGFDAYISKPIDPETFVAQIDELLALDLRSQKPERQ
ncbi:MAG TPA: response regulator [Candidatus Baltobacteraceae bacterium]|nr:response regulator [Candidatus Baltobacteraceae bacterium]